MKRILLAGVFAGLSSLAMAADLPRAAPASIGWTRTSSTPSPPSSITTSPITSSPAPC